VEGVHRILREGTSAERQLEVFRQTGSLQAVVRQLVAETREGTDRPNASSAGRD